MLRYRLTLTLSNRGSFTPATLSWLARTLTDACREESRLTLIGRTVD